MALYSFSGLPLRLSPTTVLCRSVVTVTVASSGPKASRVLSVVVMYTMNNCTYNKIRVMQPACKALYQSCLQAKDTTQSLLETLVTLLKKCCWHIKRCGYTWDVLQCSKVVAIKVRTSHQTVKVACSSVYSCAGSIICYQKCVANGCM